MHRFLEFRTIGQNRDCDLVVNDPGVKANHLRLALRADGGLWLFGAEDSFRFEVNRGSGWRTASRTRLCAGDRFRLGDAELALSALCALFAVDPDRHILPREVLVQGIERPAPVTAPAEVLEKPRRNPKTGQIEHPGKENR